MQTPDIEHESAWPLVQGPHAVPGVPQAVSESLVHPFAPQHPSGQDVASQVQTPFRQCRPGVQGALVPQTQSPEALHPLAATGSQDWHVKPAEPHADSECISHVLVLLLQQPSGHELPSHTHCPATHSCPATHRGPPPQVQVPDAEHPSAFLASQAKHTLPPAPHVAAEGGA